MRLRITPSRALFAAIAALGFSSMVGAQSVATSPVGAVTVSVNPNSDQRVGVTLLRPAVFAGGVEGIADSTLSGLASVPALSSAHYVLLKSGAAAGQWFQVSSASATSISVSGSLSAAGVSVGDTFEVRSFWTLSSLFPGGGGLPASSDITGPVALVYLNDPTLVGINPAAASAYFYHDGSQLPAGWYNNDGSFASADDVLVSPESSITLSNGTGAAANILTIGSVSTSKLGTTVVGRVAGEQDNLVYNPYPAQMTLASSGLSESGAVGASSDITSPSDLLFVYSTSSSGFNPAAQDVYFFHDGSQLPAGWYKNDGSFESSNDAVLSPGVAFTIRKASGQDTAVDWAPSVPYSL